MADTAEFSARRRLTRAERRAQFLDVARALIRDAGTDGFSLRTVDSETPRRFRTLRDGEYHDRALHPDLLPGRTDLGIHVAAR